MILMVKITIKISNIVLIRIGIDKKEDRMNALIDLTQCREHMTITVGGRDHQIRLSGTIDDPYFCGKDVCIVLGYKDIKQALQKHVKIKHKKELKGLILPNEVDVNSTSTSLGSREPLTFNEGKTIYINEPGLYSLIMNSNATFAEVFQDLVYETILPSIRKYGSYQVESRLAQAMIQLSIQEVQLDQEREAASQERQRAEEAERLVEEERQQRLQAEIDAKKKLEKALKFNQATKKVEPKEYIYIVSTDRYIPENKYKPGGAASFNLLKSRITAYNCGQSDSDLHKPVYVRKVVSYRAVEQTLEACLGAFRENANKELYIINFDWLKRCINAIIDQNDEFLKFVNDNREKMVHDTLNAAPQSLDPINLESIRLSYKRFDQEEVDLTTILDSDTIDYIKRSLSTFNPDNNVIKRVAFEHHLKTLFPEVEVDHRKRKIWDVVKMLGSTIKTNCTFKY